MEKVVLNFFFEETGSIKLVSLKDAGSTTELPGQWLTDLVLCSVKSE